MRITFKGTQPTFNSCDKNSTANTQEQSHYYYWFEFLRRNEDYAACCAAGGVGELAWLYADFGDVSAVTFKDWWGVYGHRLFAEEHKPVKLAELDSPSQWEISWSKEHVMVVTVPLDIPKRDLQRFFVELLKKRHGGKRGRKAMTGDAGSTARYPFYRNVSVETLRKQLAVYDAVMAKRRGEHKRTLAKIGADMKLVEDAMPDITDDKNTAEDKRNVMAASVSRLFRQAQRIVANTAKGQFPNSKS